MALTLLPLLAACGGGTARATRPSTPSPASSPTTAAFDASLNTPGNVTACTAATALFSPIYKAKDEGQVGFFLGENGSVLAYGLMADRGASEASGPFLPLASDLSDVVKQALDGGYLTGDMHKQALFDIGGIVGGCSKVGVTAADVQARENEGWLPK